MWLSVIWFTFAASELLSNLIAHLTTNEELKICKAVYLHVMTTNTPAIRFYESRNFRKQNFLPCYYSIDDEFHDGFLYALTINDGLFSLAAKYPFRYATYASKCLIYVSCSHVMTCRSCTFWCPINEKLWHSNGQCLHQCPSWYVWRIVHQLLHGSSMCSTTTHYDLKMHDSHGLHVCVKWHRHGAVLGIEAVWKVRIGWWQ